jgi:O-antigen/teichoic acid export membrane protein
VTFLASFGIHIIAGRMLGPDDYGLLSIIVAVISIVVFSILMGMPHAASQALARSNQLSTGVLNKGLAVQFGLGLLLVGVLILSANWMALWFDEPGLSPLLKIASLSIPVSAAAYFLIYCLNGLHRFGRQALGLASITVARLLLTALLLVAGLGLAGAVMAIPLAAVVTLLLAWILIWRMPRTRQPAEPELLTRAAQFNVTFLLVTVWYYVDPLLLGALSTDAKGVGLFMAATALAGAPESVFAPLLMVLFPTLSRSALSADSKESRFYVSRSGFYIFAVSCPLVVGAAVLSEDLLTVFFGQEFRSAHTLLAPLTAAAMLRVGFELGDVQIRASGRGSLSMRNAGILVSVHLAAAMVLVPRFGVTGMVVAVLLSSVAGLLLTAAFFRKQLGIRPPWRSTLAIPAISIVAFLPLLLLRLQGLWAIAASLPSLVFYGLMLWALGALGSEDLQRVRRLLDTLCRRRHNTDDAPSRH